MLDITRAYGLNLLFPARDIGVGHILRTHGEFARVEMELISDFLALEPSPASMLDVGANIGSICLPLAARHPAWTIVALEAQRSVAQVLAANALNNQLHNVDIHNVAAGRSEGLADFPSPPLGGEQNFGVMGFWVGDRLGSETVRVRPLDDMAPPDTRFVKMDVEGFELEVLGGAARLIERTRPNWLLEATPKNADRVRETMAVFFDHGYRLFWFFSPSATPSGVKAAPTPKADGDFCFFAVADAPPPGWDLPEISRDAIDWPMRKSAFPYLKRYGVV